MPTSIFVGTTNPGKLKEFATILSALDVSIITPDQLPSTSILEVEETGATFAENAVLKARAFYAASHIPTVAEDSGLMIDALNGEPGVHSKRFFAGSDADRNKEVLKRLQDVTNRSARFTSVLAFIPGDNAEPLLFTGVVELEIAVEPKGEVGFGYDPIVIPVGYNQTFAELGPDVKNAISHRARAIQAFYSYYKEQYVR